MITFIVMLVILIAGVYVAKTQRTYGSSLEQYITDHHPQNSGDVERLTVEYNMKVKAGKI